MLLPVSWLKEYVDFDEDTRTLADKLTQSGSHVESIDKIGPGVKNIVVGKILEISKHEDADKLVVCQIDVGEEVIQVVTGAKNVKEGDFVPVALVGSVMADGMKIKKGKLRGVESFGMLCSLEEMGFSESVMPKEAKDGIYILKGEEELGRSIIDILGLDDEIIELEITHNRPDCLSIVGMARETCATLNKDLKEPEILIKEEEGCISDYLDRLSIETDKCNRYYARILKDVKVEESPTWIQRRLMESGIRPINNIVDITNYVMLEFGQPLHAYDYDKIKGREIKVRQGNEGEKLLGLDNVTRNLSNKDIVITDESGPIGLAGIMGGLETEVSEETKTVLLEGANFNSKTIRLSSKDFGLRTEASSRFEKGVDPNLANLAVDRVCQLVEEISSARVVGSSLDEYVNPVKERSLSLRPERANKLLGTNLSTDQMMEYLKNLQLKPSLEEGKIQVSLPSFRTDLNKEVDLIEEIGRLYGFHNIESKPLVGVLTRGEKPYPRRIEDLTRDELRGLGYSDIITYSFISPRSYDKIRIEEDSELRNYIKLINPLGEDYSVMRTTLISNMMDVLSRNYNRGVESIRFYEVGNIFIPKSLPLKELPDEKKVLSIASYGSGDFYDLKEGLEKVLERLGINDVEYERESSNKTFHPGRTAKVYIKGEYGGLIGQIHEEVALSYGIKDEVYLADIDFEVLVKHADLTRTYKSLSKYPPVMRDLALVIDEEILVGQVEKLIRSHGRDLIKNVELFDIYRGDQIGQGKKSVAYSILYQSDTRTLVEDEVNKIQDDIIRDLEKVFGASLRS